MCNVLTNLEPEPVYRHFEAICRIPHSSGNTKELSDFLMAFATNLGLPCEQDAFNNVLIRKEGTNGYENSAPVMIQGHLDMVCEKETDCPLDMEKEGLKLKLENGFIRAEGTTLGGDDGIAVAYTMALLESTDIPHPPLEVVLTTDEEIGMLGAAALDCSSIKSRTLLNLDSEEEGYLLVSCAGGSRATVHLPVAWEKEDGLLLNLYLTGMRGGHSGVEIDKGRANACRLLGRTLFSLSKKAAFRITDIRGGLQDNAIPREASATILTASVNEAEIIQKAVQTFQDLYKKEYRLTDPDITLQLETEQEITKNNPVLTKEATQRVLTALTCLPNGIEKMSFDIRGLVQSSLNLGILSMDESECTLSFAVRSSVDSEKTALEEKILCLTEALGGTLEISGDYPAWEYRKDSPLRDTMIRVFEEKYGRPPVVQAIHAGVECGLFAGKLPGLDGVSFGPDIKHIHTPKEALDTGSVARTWEYLLEVLKQLK